MSLLLRSTSVFPSIASQLSRSSPVLMGSVRNAIQYNHPKLSTIQKRDFTLISVVVDTTLDAIVLTTGMAGFRRMTGFDARVYADKINDPKIRKYCYNYLDFGEKCVDKIIYWCSCKKSNPNDYNHEYRRYENNPTYMECERHHNDDVNKQDWK